MSDLRVIVVENVENSEELAAELATLCTSRVTTISEFDAESVGNYIDESNYLLELMKGEERVGFLLMMSYPVSSPAKIVLVCVSPTEKGKGASTNLIDTAKEIAKANGNPTIELEAESAAVMEKVYAKQGFTPTAEIGRWMSATLGGSRLHKQARRTKRHRRNLKHRKLRKLATRRR
jgi:hypothetical protein